MLRRQHARLDWPYGSDGLPHRGYQRGFHRRLRHSRHAGECKLRCALWAARRAFLFTPERSPTRLLFVEYFASRVRFP